MSITPRGAIRTRTEDQGVADPILKVTNTP